MRRLTGFLPSRHGFHFSNQFPSVPAITIPLLFGKLKLGDASNGLCGGMVFCALDHFLAGRPIPDVRTHPVAGALFETLVSRLLNSFNFPFGVLKYAVLMHPAYPDEEKRGRLAPRGRAWRTIRVEWPIIKKILDSGQPCPLGLVRVKTTDLSKLGQNHQVLATGYDVADDILSLDIYDPNFPDNDDLKLRLSLAAPGRATPLEYAAPDRQPVFAFFHVPYKFRTPPPAEV